MAGKFVANVQGEPPGWDSVFQFIGAANGYAKWGRIWSLTSLDDDVNYTFTVRNLGTIGGGRHLRVLRSDTAAVVVAVTDAGLAVTGAISGTTLAATGAISGASLALTGTLTVGSTTLVANLNADLLDGHDTSYFATAASLADYVEVAGDTMTGDLVIEGELTVDGNATIGTDNSDRLYVLAQAEFSDDVIVGDGVADRLLVRGGTNGLQLAYDSNVLNGVFTLGATEAADPSLRVRDNSGDLVAEFFPSGSTYQFEVTGDAHVTDDFYVAGDLSGGNIVAGATTMSGTEELRVVGQSRLEGSVTITSGGLNVSGGSSSFDDAVSITNNGLTVAEGITVTSGGIGVTGSSLFSNALTLQGDVTLQSGAIIDFDAGSGAGFTESSWSGYVTIKHDGVTKYVPYLSTAP